jgi:ABC-type multidrug transport system ATPase subunit
VRKASPTLTSSLRSHPQVTVNGSSNYSTEDLFSFVEQDDALLGVLTVRETIAFAARLSLGSSYPGIDRHIDDTLRSLGLQDIANNKIGTPLQRGISGE